MSVEVAAIFVAIGTTMGAVIYHLGRYSMRVDVMRAEITDLRTTMNDLREAADELRRDIALLGGKIRVA